jgi:molybdopterin synthase sulfur carrier subunit
MKLIYFAWIRERLNRSGDEVDPPADVVTVSDLLDWLADGDEGFALLLEDRKAIRVARDEELVDHDAPIAGAGTIALFPPMTGG